MRRVAGITAVVLILTFVSALSVATPPSVAHAASQTEPKIAVVDFQKALDQVQEGQQARERLQGMYQQKQKTIQGLGEKLQQMRDDYERQAAILSTEARSQKEQELSQAQMQYQQAYLQSQSEMQNAYAEVMDDLITKMKEICQQIGKEKGYTLILETSQGGVVYNGGAIDITDELIRRYDAANPVKRTGSGATHSIGG